MGTTTPKYQSPSPFTLIALIIQHAYICTCNHHTYKPMPACILTITYAYATLGYTLSAHYILPVVLGVKNFFPPTVGLGHAHGAKIKGVLGGAI